jgi:hypothetical protein
LEFGSGAAWAGIDKLASVNTEKIAEASLLLAGERFIKNSSEDEGATQHAQPPVAFSIVLPAAQHLRITSALYQGKISLP